MDRTQHTRYFPKYTNSKALADQVYSEKKVYRPDFYSSGRGANRYHADGTLHYSLPLEEYPKLRHPIPHKEYHHEIPHFNRLDESLLFQRHTPLNLLSFKKR